MKRLMFLLVMIGLLLTGCNVGKKSPKIQTYIVDRPIQSELASSNQGSYGSHAGHDHGGLVWAMPAGWQKLPHSGMRIASFALPGSTNADVTIVRLGVQSGSLISNVNRWLGQLSLPPVSESDLKHITSPFSLKQSAITATSVSLGGNSDMAMEVVIINTPSNTWFIKLMAPSAQVKSHSVTFYEFVRTIDGF